MYKQHYDEVLKESKDVLEFKATASIPVFGQMEFRFVFKDHIARLYMIENVYREFNGYQEIYGEQITEINCEDDRDSVVDYVFALLNVKVVDEVDLGKIPDEDPEKVRAIIFDKLYLTMVAKNYLKESSDDERDTFEEMINDLKGGGEYGKRVLKHFIDRIEKRPDIMQLKDEDGYNEALNDALIGALEVATTEEDMKDPHNKKLYEDLYKKRFKNTEEDLKKAQEKVNEKDLKKVADGVLGRGTSDKLYTEEELASLIDGKREETKQSEQDNSFVDDLLKNPIVKQVIENVAGHTVGENREENQGASRTRAEEEAQTSRTRVEEEAQAAADEAARRAEEEARRAQQEAGRAQQGQTGPEKEDDKKGPKPKTDNDFRAAMAAQNRQYDYGKYKDIYASVSRTSLNGGKDDKTKTGASSGFDNLVFNKTRDTNQQAETPTEILNRDKIEPGKNSRGAEVPASIEDILLREVDETYDPSAVETSTLVDDNVAEIVEEKASSVEAKGDELSLDGSELVKTIDELEIEPATTTDETAEATLNAFSNSKNMFDGAMKDAERNGYVFTDASYDRSQN